MQELVSFSVRNLLLSQIKVKRKLLREAVSLSLSDRDACPIDLKDLTETMKLIKASRFDEIVTKNFVLPKQSLRLKVSDDLYRRARKSLGVLKRKRVSLLPFEQLSKVNEALVDITINIYKWKPEQQDFQSGLKIEKDFVVGC